MFPLMTEISDEVYSNYSAYFDNTLEEISRS